MKFALLASVLLSFQGAPPPQTATFTDKRLGLSFDHPATWIVGKPEKNSTKVRIPIAGTTESADLEIYRGAFASPPDIWQTSQLRLNEQLRRRVTRQWEQEILGAPMLLTRIEFEAAGRPMNTLTGLFYTRSPEKLLFRLTAPASEFDKAQYEFETAMQTLRTVSGGLPQAEDPDRRPDPQAPAQKPAEPPPPRRRLETNAPTVKLVKAPVVIPATVSERNVELRVPSGWTAEAGDGGGMTLRHPSLSSQIRLSLHSTLDSEAAMRTLLRASGESLKDFQKVSTRQEDEPKANQAGCTVVAIWRTGVAASGNLTTLDATGAMGEFYFLVSYRPQNVADRKLLEALLNAVSIEPAA